MVGTSYYDGNAEIYLYTATQQGTLTVNLSKDHAEDISPRLNRNADQVVFVSKRDHNREIYRVNTNGSELKRLTATPMDEAQPFWSPNGQRIIFASKRDGNWNIYVMNADGSGQTPLVADAADDIMPSWSPDGRTIAWVRVTGESGAIWMMNANGSGQKALTQPMRYLQHPNWSSDGAHLVFDYDRNGDGFNELAIINTNGTGIQPVVVNTMLPVGQYADLSAAAWAPGDEWILVGAIVYNIANNKISVHDAHAGGVALANGMLEWIAYYQIDIEPDLRSLDLIAPVTQLEYLPTQTRGSKVTVRWNGYDTGLDEGLRYDVQYRVGENQPWQDWQHHVTSSEAEFIGTPGSRVSFRVRGIDAAGNFETWHTTTGDTTTTFYTWRFAGQITDNRGYPIPAAPLTVRPNTIGSLATNLAGGYSALLPAAGTYTFSPRAPGFAAPPATTLNADRDRAFSPYLPPTDSIIQNGTFEPASGGLSGWTAQGTSPASLTPNAHTGARAVQFGQACASVCLTEREPIATTASPFEMTMLGLAADDTQTVHMLWLKQDMTTFFTGPELDYQKRTPDGVWSAPMKIGNGDSAKMTVDGKQNLHVIWRSNESRMIYRQLSAQGVWSEPQDLGVVSDMRIVADSQGRAHVFYYCLGELGCLGNIPGTGAYRIRNTDGTWQPERKLPMNVSSAALGPHDTVRVVWFETFMGYAATMQPDGNVSSVTTFGEGSYQIYEPRITVDAQGIAHVVWSINQDMYYVHELPDGTFTLPMHMSGGSSYPYLAEAQGTLYLITTSPNPNDYGVYVRTKAITGEWSAPSLLYGTRGWTTFTTDRRGRIHIVRWDQMTTSQPEQLYYQATSLMADASDTTIAQTVAIPTAMHRPTLAFDYKLAGGSAETGSQITVSVEDGTETPQVFAVATSGGWNHAAFDLSAWVSKTVTITIGLHQAANAPRATAVVDDISLGSWLTPVVESISRYAVETDEATQVTITGDNFVAVPTLQLGSTLLTNVELVDTHTIKATIPAHAKIGQYRLVVTNPAGQRTAGPTVTVGHMLYLPATRR